MKVKFTRLRINVSQNRCERSAHDNNEGLGINTSFEGVIFRKKKTTTTTKRVIEKEKKSLVL